jgi:nickel-dependent lactate racemase
MEMTFGFGNDGLAVSLPEHVTYEVLRAHAAGALPNPVPAIRQALEAPVAGPSLRELARGRKTAAISVCDITRPAPNPITLPPILDVLHEAGMRDEDITLCIATGLHRQATAAELATILSPATAARYPIVNHDAKDKAAHRYLGETQRGTPVWVHERFVDADLHITLGFIEQHLMLGFSGGRKLIAPGLAAQESIKVIHSPRFMRESLATEGSIEHNPLHAELLEIARMVRHDFMLDVTLTRSREISGIFAGEPVAAHAAGVAELRRSSLQLLDEPADAVITSAAGRPLDLTFYQTIKGVTAAQHVARPGAPILVIGECSEGVGSHEFAEFLRMYRGAEEFLRSIEDTTVVPDQWQLEKLAMVALKHPLYFYTPGVSAEQMGALGAGRFDSAKDAVQALLGTLPAGARVALIPDGPYAFAAVRAKP